MDEIYNFKTPFQKELQTLYNQKTNSQLSEKITIGLEKKYAELKNNFNTIRQRMDYCKSAFQQILLTYQTIVN